MEQIRRRSSELRRRKWEICLPGPRKRKKSKKSSPADSRPASHTTSRDTTDSLRFDTRVFTMRLTVCSSFSTKSTFFCVVSEARTALWLLQASLALSYESLAVMNFRQEFPTRCQLSPHTFSALDGATVSGPAASPPTGGRGAYPVGRCTPGCGAPTGSSGPQRSSCSWFSCCTRTTGCPWGTARTPPRPPGTHSQASQLAQLGQDSHKAFFPSFSIGK